MNNSNKCNILLIGKYPPMQGGVSSKSYWLFEKLKKHDFEFQIITSYVDRYITLKNKEEKFVHYITSKEVPWHIPNSELLFDKLLNKSLEVIKDFIPDIIETNYLWPYCGVASYLSLHLKKPLLIRHAGSDILKFYKNKDFSVTIKSYFDQAEYIITNNTSQKIIQKLCSNKSKVKLMDRYIPDPESFFSRKIKKKYDILFAGKINYFWNLKGIEYLLKYIKTDSLKALFLIDGKYVEDIYSIINKEKLNSNIDFSTFIHPCEMPEIINQCKSVWCWEEINYIQDFSNLISESLFCKVSCFINYHEDIKEEFDRLFKFFPELIIPIDPLKTKSIKHLISEADYEKSHLSRIEQKRMYNDFINQNIELYHSFLRQKNETF